MLVAERSRRSSPRVLYGILAESALEQFNANAPEEAQRRAYLQNLIRLLEMYRYNTLRRPSPRAVLDRRQSDLKARARERVETAAVEQALDSARQSVYHGFSKEQLVDQLKEVFGRVMNNEFGAISEAELLRAKNFLAAFAAALRT